MYIINIIKASFWENLNFQNSLPFMNILYFDDRSVYSKRLIENCQ